MSRYSYFECTRDQYFRVIEDCPDPDDGAETVADLPYCTVEDTNVSRGATLSRSVQLENAVAIVRLLNKTRGDE